MSKYLPSYLYADEASCIEELQSSFLWRKSVAGRTEKRAAALIEKIREAGQSTGELEAFLQQYSLSSEEGLALMCLAEALLRIPDKKTAHALIRDKVLAANWLSSVGDSKDWMVKAAGVGLFVTSKTLDSVLARVGEPFILEAMVKAMRMMGRQFVLGPTIEDAVQNAQSYHEKGYRMSYDVLGEGARTQIDADRYYEAYHHAIGYVGQRAGPSRTRRPSISVKLSALHPRYEVSQEGRCIPEMIVIVKKLALHAAAHDVAITIDAEEVERLEMSLKIIEAVLSDNMFEGWDGFGMAIQAYQKRSLALIDHMAEVCTGNKRRMDVRLVKGAYWDREIKRAQVMGLADYPVYTRKTNTDFSYMACTAKLFANRSCLYPMLATHNAQSVSAIIEMAAREKISFELQRLHGMGESLFDIVIKEEQVPVSVYAPVGLHEDLLPYLVRRLLENGANSSFVHKLLDEKTPIATLTTDPIYVARNNLQKRHPKIPRPRDIYKDLQSKQGRRNSRGIDFDDKGVSERLLKKIAKVKGNYSAAPLIGGKTYGDDSVALDVFNPADTAQVIGRYHPANVGLVDKAFRVAGEAFDDWEGMPSDKRASVIEKFADLLEKNQAELMGLCVKEAGKTLLDARDELREAVDFCLYYASQGRAKFASEGTVLQGPTGESNILYMQGRGTFVCISPWNFPLAIFTGQIVAALMAGNCVVAKPAEQTPLIAMRVVQLMHDAGVPVGAINLLFGDGNIGGAIVQHRDVAGVAFTGSTETARIINRDLAAKDGPIVPLIAETGGQNAMIVDSSALPEHVIDDVISSAFGGAGQRCSALRILYLQSDVADKILRMLKGAVAEVSVGDPSLLSSDIGPVIDEAAHGMLMKHRKKLHNIGELVCQMPMDKELKVKGHFFAPLAFELPDMKGLTREVFGPILHIIRYEADKLDEALEEINDCGYGLTLGVHSRIDHVQEYIVSRMKVGNAYVNRSMTGAVVGVQPFGGQGLSGTGPKAGGPHYLQRFATEKVVSIDTTASGGNTTLVSLEE